MTARHSPCLSKWQQRGLTEKRLKKGGRKWGEWETEREREVWRRKGGMEGLLRWSIPRCKQEPIMANRSSVVRTRGGERQRNSLHHRLPERGIAKTSRRLTTCNKTSIISPYGVYYSFIIHCEIRILAYYITADRLKMQKNRKSYFLKSAAETICFPLESARRRRSSLRVGASGRILQAELCILIFSLMPACVWNEDNMRAYWSPWGN